MPYAELNGLNLYYEEFGRGETVLFLHSHFSRGLLAFSGQILPFSGRYRCLFPDFRGHGRTTCDDLNWNSRMVADDMAMFLDKLRRTRLSSRKSSEERIYGFYRRYQSQTFGCPQRGLADISEKYRCRLAAASRSDRRRVEEYHMPRLFHQRRKRSVWNRRRTKRKSSIGKNL